MALQLIGVAPGRLGAQPIFGAHRSIVAHGWTGLAIEVDLPVSGAPDEACLADWAMRQNMVLSGYVASGPVLPIALGGVFSSAAAIEAHLGAHSPDYQALLEALGDCVEYAAELLEDPNPQARTNAQAQNSGLAYLTARQSARDRRLARAVNRGGFASALVPKLAGLAKEVIERPQRPGRISAWALLVPRSQVTALTQGLEAEAQEAAKLGLKLRLIGPSPAFSFVKEAARHAQPAI